LVALAIAASTFLLTVPDSTRAFTVPTLFGRPATSSSPKLVATIRFVSSVDESPPSGSTSNDDDDMSDEQLLRQTPKAQLVALCEQFELSSTGTRTQLLERLRGFAKEQTEKERQRLLARRKKVEEGSEDDREKFEIVDDGEIDEDDDDDGVFFYYQSVEPDQKKNVTNSDEKKAKEQTNKSKKPPMNSQSVITAPPPPPIEPDENGERVVTVYSTTDQNDLTGVAASQPGQAAAIDPMTSTIGEPEDAPWDMNHPQKNKQSSSSDIDAAREALSDLVQSLLALTGAPAFQQEGDELSFLGVIRRPSAYSSPEGFVGFDPSKVPTDMLTSASTSIRAGRGKVLQEVLREFELRSVGHDGAAGDKIERGGGHYLQVSKVRSFLEGYRRAEVRRLARETATLLLDKLVSEGIEGLDIVLASMTRSSDDTNQDAGELNDSLLDYLNDAIRQQEKKVDQLVDSVKKVAELEGVVAEEPEDLIDKLWTVESEEGQRVETFDPKDPKNKRALRAEFEKAQRETQPQLILPKSAPEKLLLLLKLLRERIKTEAAFSHDEKARNLRVLAYCLHLDSDVQRKELIMKEFGSSLDVSVQQQPLPCFHLKGKTNDDVLYLFSLCFI
jgi:hypothetical protein